MTEAPLRITRRGRLLTTALAVSACLAGVSVARDGAAAASHPPPPAVSVVTVLPGETLWGIAERVAPAEDPREVVARLTEANGLPMGQLRAGQELLVPAPAS